MRDYFEIYCYTKLNKIFVKPVKQTIVLSPSEITNYFYSYVTPYNRELIFKDIKNKEFNHMDFFLNVHNHLNFGERIDEDSVVSFEPNLGLCNDLEILLTNNGALLK